MTDTVDIERDFPGPYWYLGTVINRDDPEGRYRIKASVSGEVGETDWAVPLGFVTGKKRGGGPFVPPKGAPVIVFWLGGNINSTVVYIPGMFFEGWIPTGHAINSDGGDNFVWQNDRMRIEVDTRDSSAGLRITNLDESSGTDAAGTEVEIDVDFVTKQVAIAADLGVRIDSDGAVQINGGSVAINGRLVAPGADPI